MIFSEWFKISSVVILSLNPFVHTNLVLLPKKEQVHSFDELRPISLSNFINKIFSRIIHDRVEIFDQAGGKGNMYLTSRTS